MLIREMGILPSLSPENHFEGKMNPTKEGRKEGRYRGGTVKVEGWKVGTGPFQVDKSWQRGGSEELS